MRMRWLRGTFWGKIIAMLASTLGCASVHVPAPTPRGLFMDLLPED
jgi:hypothetical protein